MADDSEYQAKFNEMQKYLPFLRKVIEKLRVNNEQLADNPRKGQLQKMEMLHDLLTNKAKKLKIDTLLKCEGVLIKLHTKMENQSPFLQSDNETSNMNSTSNIQQQKLIPITKVVPNNQIEIVDITGPASPPPQDMEEVLPVEIPTERRCSPIITNELSKPHKNPHCSKGDKRSNDHCQIPQDQKQHQHHNNRNLEREKPEQTRNRSFERADNYKARDKSRNRSRSRWESTKNTSPASLGSSLNSSSHNSTSSNGSFQRDRNLGNHRNPDSGRSTPTPKQQQRRWEQRKSDSYSNQRRNNTADKNDAYSPKASWDEIARPREKTPVVDIIDLLDLSQSPTLEEPEVVQTFQETIFKYKNPESVRAATSATASKTGTKVFARLGEKVKPEESSSSMSENNFENFKVKVSNERAATLQRAYNASSSSASSLASNKLSPTKAVPISIPVKVPTIPEVLKSPPLSASDISNLLYESMDISPKASPNISDVGTRRPAKSTEVTNSTSTASKPASLDMVRKKLAMITKNSPQFRESPASPISPQISIASPVAPTHSIPSERLALKYNPHRRAESVSSSECGNSPAQSTSSTLKPSTDPRLGKQTSPLPNFNVLPSINLQDPRLRRATTSLSMNLIPHQVPVPTSLHQVQQTQSIPITQAHSRHFQPHVNAPVGPPVFPPRNDPRYMRGTSRPPEYSNSNYNYRKEGIESGNHNDPRMHRRDNTPVNSTIPGRSRTPGRQFVDNNNKYQQPSSFNKSGPTKNVPPNKQIQTFNKKSSAQNQKTTTDYSSEENWDSEPETTASSKDFSYSQQTISPSTSPKFTAVSRTTPVPKLTTSVKSTLGPKANTQTYSSEENWDSEPETATTNTKTVAGTNQTVNQIIRPIWTTQTPNPTQNPKSSQTAKLPTNVISNIVENSSPRDMNSAPRNTWTNTATKPWLTAEPKTTNSQESTKSTLKTTIISNIAIASPCTTIHIPMLPTYATHHIGQKPIWNANKFNQPPPTQQNKAAGADGRAPSPEENWDLDTESSPVVKPTAAVPQISKPKNIPPHLERNESPVPNNAKFSALLNDKSERIKYFESKKQKFAPPRTYGEFKQAKARAAAEEAAKRATQEVDKSADVATPKPADEIEIPAAILSKPPPVSTLDILYRNSNFSTCELPKTNTGFKIPKKQTASKKEVNVEVDPKEVNKAAAKEKPEENTITKVKVKVKDKQEVKMIAKDLKSKHEQKVEQNKKHWESNDKNKAREKKDMSSKDNNIDAKTEEPTAKNPKELSNETAEKIMSTFNAKKSYKDIDALKEPAEKILKNVDPRTKNSKLTTKKNDEPSTKPTENVQKSKLNDEPLIIDEDGPVENDIAAPVVDVIAAPKYSEKEVIDEVVVRSLEEEVPTKNEPEPEPDPTKTAVPTKIDVKITRTTNELPRRILKRRCTMIAYASASEVDKEKIHSANALLFEDLQHQQKKFAQKAEEEAKQLARKNKFLAEMFQKTDDNCTVSTQNIITGKRRTRATANLNEVAFSKSVFKHMKTTTMKKEATAIETTTATVESPKATAAVAKTTKNSPFKKSTTAGTKGATLAAAKKKDESSVKNVKEHEDQNRASSSSLQLDDIIETAAPKIKKTAAKRKSTITAIPSVESVAGNETGSLAKIASTTTSSPADNISSSLQLDDIIETASPKIKKTAAKRKSTITAIPSVESVADNETGSLDKIASTTTSSPADNIKDPIISVQDIITELVQPEKRAYYLSKLRQIFSEDKMKRIEAFAEGNQIAENGDDDGENEQLETDGVDNDQTVNYQKHAKRAPKSQYTPLKNTRKRKARCNELDRLNADIRDMFICEGVLTANGRRMCTLVAEDKMTEVNVSKVDETKASTLPKELKKSPKATISTSPPLRMLKAKVVISPLSKRQLRRSTRASKSVLNTSEANSEETEEEESVLDDSEIGTTTEIEDLTSLTEEVTDVELLDTPPRRRMPVLKPNTPIKLPEEDDTSTADAEAPIIQPSLPKSRKVEVKLAKINVNTKPCPKSKKIVKPAETEDFTTSALESESEDNDLNTEEAIESHTKDCVANTNPNWHSQTKYAKWCVICNVKLHHAAMHYKMHHPEHYAARLAPTILQQFKQGKLSKPLFGISAKRMRFWFYRCPFCLHHNRCPVKTWLEHFVTHTGEYNYECSKCHKGGNKPSVIEKHIKKTCSGATVVRNTFFCWSLTQSVVKAHVCHLCNFIQLERGNLERHYVQQHGCDKNIVDVLGYSITLLSTEGVEIVSQKKATILEAAAIKEMSHNELVIDDDNEDNDVETNKYQEETKCNETVDPSKTNKDLNKRKTTKNIVTENKTVQIERKPLIINDEANCESDNTMALQIYSDEVVASGTEEDLAAKPTNTLANKEKRSINSHEDVQAVEDNILALTNQDSLDTEKQQLISKSPEKEARDVQDEVLALAAQAEISTVEEIPKSFHATNSNVFMPTRETNDSPTTVIFAQSLLTNEQDTTDTDVVNSAQNSTTSNSKVKNAISIAERLTQRFKDLTAMAILPKATAEKFTAGSTAIIEEEHANNANTKLDQTFENVSANTSDSQNGSLVIAEENFDLDSFEGVPEKSSDNSNSNSDTKDEDDGNWEDIEVTEMAPSTSSSSSVISKDSKTYKRKQIFQKLNRLYANNKFRKALPNGDVKKKRTTANTNTEKVSAKNTSTISVEKSSIDVATISNIAGTSSTSQLGFRPMITNLADLLPDSPCNDPIELVPELTPLEPLQDLNDISSILDSNFSALDTQNLIQQMELETSNSVCINADNQQTSIQEALDFVSEQEHQFDALNMTTITKDLQMTPNSIQQIPQVIINRIQNVGYSVTLDQEGISYKYYCLSDRCTFLYSSEAVGLENHYLGEHPQSRWMGYCNACKEQIIGNSEITDYSLSQEIKHMLEKHTASTTTTTATEASTSTSIATFAEIKEKPRIKLRRLSGDCLSSGTTTNSDTSTDFTTINTTGTISTMLNTRLFDLLNAKPRPPTKKMPPQLDIQFTDSLFSDDAVPSTNKSAAIAIEPLFKNVGNELTIISVASGDPIDSMKTLQAQLQVQTPLPTPPTCELQISSVVSLSNTAQSDQAKAIAKSNEASDITTITTASSTTTASTTSASTTSASITSQKPASSIQMPKISNVCSLSARAGALWAKQIASERVELQKSAAESHEISRLLRNPSRPSNTMSHNTSRAGITDSPEPEVVSETVPIAQATSGDYLITQTVSAHYEEGTTDAQLGFNISIAATNVSAPVSSNSNSGSTSPITVRSLPSASQNVGNKHKNGNSTSTTTVTNNIIPTYGVTMSRPFYKCLGKGCKYQTRVTVAMSDHLRFHERRNLSTHREYFRCSHCNHLAEDVDGFIKHAEDKHLAVKGVQTNSSSANTVTMVTTSGMSSANALTQKIQNILKSSAERRNSVSSETTTSVANTTNTAIAAPVKPYRQQLEETIKDIVAPTGVPDDKLYRCIIEGCRAPLKESTFHTHLVYHLSTIGVYVNTTNYNYKCPHCTASYTRPAGIKAHIKCHARHRYFCYICMETSSNAGQILKHFSEKHWRTMNMYTANLLTATTPTTSETAEADVDAPVYYVAYATHISDAEVQQFGEKLIVESARRKAGSKTHFKPSEIPLLPIQPIFQKEIACAECAYKTKVRTNMLRHLQAHKAGVAVGASGAVDPINPVPCLNTNEKHFDKMTNMAASSLPLAAASSSTPKPAIKLPYAYIAETKRFTCGVVGCQYLTISEDIFRSHLSALHGNTNSYSCPFCHEEICKRGLSVDRVVQHLRFHGQRLFQCEECDYLHYMKNVVERHINDKHATLRVNLATHLRVIESGSGRLAEHVTTTSTITGKKFKEPTLQSSDTIATDASTSNNAKTASITDSASKSSSSVAKSKHKWSCDLCAYKAVALSQITQHCQARHGCNQPYQCKHCVFGAQQLSQIMTHIDQQHDGRPREARNIFHKLQQQNGEPEDAADTRPLWQRDDPKRVRHIRGILMENEEESEQYRKRLCLDIDDDDDDDAAADDGEVIQFPAIDMDYAAKQKARTNSIPSASATATIAPQALFLGIYEFGCLHCDFKGNSFGAAQKHWHDEHNAAGAGAETAKPFYFRLLKQLECPECLKYTGCYSELQLHLQNTHKTRIYIAADPGTKRSGILSCGYCGFSCTRNEQLVKHFQREAHKPQDLKLFSAAHFKNVATMGRKQSYLQCTMCAELFANREAIVAHARAKHENEEGFSFKELCSDTPIFRCAICNFTSVTELCTLRHMIDHYGQFKRCHFCKQPQTTFNGYMQHCYSDHRQEIRRFSDIYPLREIKKYLLQMFVIFANGFIINKKNLRQIIPHGSEARIHQLYEEICKTSQEPPIPRLSIARLVARKSIEASQFSTSATSNSNSNSNSPWNSSSFVIEDEPPRLSSSTAAAMQLAGNAGRQSLAGSSSGITAKKICKRRSTVALGSHENPSQFFNVPNKKPKVLINLPPPAPVLVSVFSEDSNSSVTSSASSSRAKPEQAPYSFYGSRPKMPDLSKIYTKIAIGGLEATSLSIDKFKLLFPMDVRVVLDRREVTNYLDRTKSHVRKACPASQKYRFN